MKSRYTLAFVVWACITCYLLFNTPQWHWVNWHIYKENFSTCEAAAVSIEKVRSRETVGGRYGGGENRLYEITLDNGTKLAVYRRILDDAQLLPLLEEHLNEKGTYSYIPIHGFFTEAYVLRAVSVQGKTLLDARWVTDWYQSFLHRAAWIEIVVIIWMVLCITLPVVCGKCWRAWKRRKKAKEKIRRKAKNEEVRRRRELEETNKRKLQ